MTIIGIKAPGVPDGTKCANIPLVWNTMDHSILPNQIGKARVTVIDKCLVQVKIYGNSPMKLEKIINKKNLIKIKTEPGIIKLEKTANNSPSRYKTNFSSLFVI